jgi:hypothetical protein
MVEKMKKNTESLILDAIKKPVVMFDGRNHRVNTLELDKAMNNKATNSDKIKKVRKVKCNVCLDYCGKTKEDCLVSVYTKLKESFQTELNACTEDPMFRYNIPGESGKSHTLSTDASGEILMLNAKKWAAIESRIRFLDACIDRIPISY